MPNDDELGDNLSKEFRELVAKLLHDAFQRQLDEWELMSGVWYPIEVVIAEAEELLRGKGWDAEDEP